MPIVSVTVKDEEDIKAIEMMTDIGESPLRIVEIIVDY